MEYTIKQLDIILQLHRKWLNGEEGGKKANLGGANLEAMNLRNANLMHANLRSANLSGASLKNVNLTEADLKGARLTNAFMRGANLDGAFLWGADLRGADLRDVKGLEAFQAAQTCILPDGDIIGWKKLKGGRVCKLRIPAEAKRSNGTGRKCRAEYAEVLEIWDCGEQVSEGKSLHDRDFVYRVGETVRPDSFCDDRWNECAPGIHFFITRVEAENYLG